MDRFLENFLPAGIMAMEIEETAAPLPEVTLKQAREALEEESPYGLCSCGCAAEQQKAKVPAIRTGVKACRVCGELASRKLTLQLPGGFYTPEHGLSCTQEHCETFPSALGQQGLYCTKHRVAAERKFALRKYLYVPVTGIGVGAAIVSSFYPAIFAIDHDGWGMLAMLGAMLISFVIAVTWNVYRQNTEMEKP